MWNILCCNEDLLPVRGIFCLTLRGWHKTLAGFFFVQSLLTCSPSFTTIFHSFVNSLHGIVCIFAKNEFFVFTMFANRTVYMAFFSFHKYRYRCIQLLPYHPSKFNPESYISYNHSYLCFRTFIFIHKMLSVHVSYHYFYSCNFWTRIAKRIRTSNRSNFAHPH